MHTRDVLEELLHHRKPDLRELAREPLFVPDTMALSDFLLELQQKRSHTAVVLDEHGTAIGLAFREDALEEIVGPLGDEFDEEAPDFVEIAPGTVELLARVPLPEACDRLGIELEDDQGEGTIGGHVVAELGRLPRRGDVVEIGAYRVTVLEVLRRRVHRAPLRTRGGARRRRERGLTKRPAAALPGPVAPARRLGVPGRGRSRAPSGRHAARAGRGPHLRAPGRRPDAARPGGDLRGRPGRARASASPRTAPTTSGTATRGSGSGASVSRRRALRSRRKPASRGRCSR